jgi:hypothetical protein
MLFFGRSGRWKINQQSTGILTSISASKNAMANAYNHGKFVTIYHATNQQPNQHKTDALTSN